MTEQKNGAAAAVNKARWVRPVVSQMQAGAAEAANGNRGDGQNSS